jgi:hypothetical protein
MGLLSLSGEVKKEVNKMSEEWNSMKVDLEAFFGASPDVTEDVSNTCRSLIAMGDNDSSMQEQAKNAMQSILRGTPGSPINRRGSKGLPTTVATIVDSIKASIRNDFGETYDSNPAYQAVLLRHGKAVTNGASPNYIDGAEFGAYLAKKAGTVLARLYKSEEWDGTIEGLSATILILEDDEEE